jgi:hypothetical protein
MDWKNDFTGSESNACPSAQLRIGAELSHKAGSQQFAGLIDKMVGSSETASWQEGNRVRPAGTVEQLSAYAASR